MSVAHAGSVIVPDPSDKLIAPAIFQLPASQHCAAKIRQQMEFFAQTADMKGGRSLNPLNISLHFICGLCDSVVQFTGLRIIASGRKKEHIVSWRNKEDRLTMEENLQPPILYIG